MITCRSARFESVDFAIDWESESVQVGSFYSSVDMSNRTHYEEPETNEEQQLRPCENDTPGFPFPRHRFLALHKVLLATQHTNLDNFETRHRSTFDEARVGRQLSSTSRRENLQHWSTSEDLMQRRSVLF